MLKGSQPKLHRPIPVWPWAGYLTSVGLSSSSIKWVYSNFIGLLQGQLKCWIWSIGLRLFSHWGFSTLHSINNVFTLIFHKYTQVLKELKADHKMRLKGQKGGTEPQKLEMGLRKKWRRQALSKRAGRWHRRGIQTTRKIRRTTKQTAWPQGAATSISEIRLPFPGTPFSPQEI